MHLFLLTFYLQYNTIQNNTIQYNTKQYNTKQYNTKQYNTIQYNTIQYKTIQYKTIQYKTIQYNTSTNTSTICLRNAFVNFPSNVKHTFYLFILLKSNYSMLPQLI